ncbi:MAG: hypothetical protein RL708_701, partial [Bacteroidota bacterium]
VLCYEKLLQKMLINEPHLYLLWSLLPIEKNGIFRRSRIKKPYHIFRSKVFKNLFIYVLQIFLAYDKAVFLNVHFVHQYHHKLMERTLHGGGF